MKHSLILYGINRKRFIRGIILVEWGACCFGQFLHFLRFLFGGNEFFRNFAIERGVDTIHLSQ